MTITIKSIREEDFDDARKFAIRGMHLDWYATNSLELYFYSKYFLCVELSKATRALAAYSGDELVGIVLVSMKNEPKIFTSFFRRVFISLYEFVFEKFYSDSADAYEQANAKMLRDFRKKNDPDGELNFFAVDPNRTGQGVGTLLLNELERQETGKLIYVFTDSGSTYQFYQQRQFQESGKYEVILKIKCRDLPLTCFLFSKKL